MTRQILKCIIDDELPHFAQLSHKNRSSSSRSSHGLGNNGGNLYLCSFCAQARGQQDDAGTGGFPWVCTG